MEVKKLIDYTLIEILKEFPFYGHILVQLPKIYLEKKENNHNISTFAVGKNSQDECLIKLYVCEEYVHEIYNEHKKIYADLHIREVIKHEILHIVFSHLSVQLPDRTRAAVAADLSVNSYCIKDNFVSKQDPITKMKIHQGCFADDYNLEPKQSMVWYYNQLLNNKKFKEQCESGAFGPEGILSDVVNRHDIWKKIADDPLLADMMKDLARKAAQLCNETSKGWGNTPGDLIDQIEDLIATEHEILPWQTILRLFVANAAESMLDYTMKRRSRRFGTRPGTKKEDVLNLAIAIDTSGSISKEQLQMFFNELYWISKNGAVITVFEADTEIGREYPYSQFDGKVTGRGGTDLEPVLKEVSGRKFDALIYFTDFYAPKIKKNYNIPVLWILSQCHYNSKEEYPYPWGIFLHIDRDMNAELG